MSLEISVLKFSMKFSKEYYYAEFLDRAFSHCALNYKIARSVIRSAKFSKMNLSVKSEFF